VQLPAKATSKTAISVQTNENNIITHRRLVSSSQLPKRRQLAHGARNRAGQLIELQPPAKATKSPVQTDETSPIVVFRSNSQARKQRQLAHGARNRAAQLIVVQPPAKWTRTTTISVQTNATTSPIVVLCSNSQLLKRRQLAHGARNRAAQLIVGQEPAKSTKATSTSLPFRPTQTHHPIVTSIPTHRYVSDDSWPTVLGIVPVS
jgi:hypothetical protein